MKKKIDINRVTINYEEIGDGIPILFLHGYGLHLESLKFSSEVLFDKEPFKRIYIDLPGMGQSTYNDSIQNSDDMLQVVLKFIQEVIGNEESFSIVGHSYGGYLARGVQFHLPQQVNGVVLICPVIKPDYNERTLPEHKTVVEDVDYINTLDEEDKEDLDYLVVKSEHVIKRTLKEIFQPMSEDETLLIRVKNNGYGFSIDIDIEMSSFNGPALFLMGKHDSVTGYHDVFDILPKYPNASFVVLDNAGHNLYIEQEELFNHHMIVWLEEIKNKKAIQ